MSMVRIRLLFYRISRVHSIYTEITVFAKPAKCLWASVDDGLSCGQVAEFIYIPIAWTVPPEGWKLLCKQLIMTDD